MKRIVYGIILAILFNGCEKQVTYGLVITNVGFFDGEKDHQTVHIGINNDTIAIVSPVELMADSIIEGKGKYIIPGLVNSHTHIWTPEQLKEGYDVGILANMGLHSSVVSRDSVLKEKSKNAGYPFFYTSGFAATVPNGHPTHVSSNPIETINDAVSVKNFVNNRINEGVDFIKIVRDGNELFGDPPLPTLSYDSIKEIIDFAHEKKLVAVVHTGSLTEMLEVSKSKPDGFVHLWQFSKDSELTTERIGIIKNSGAFIVPTAIMAKKGGEQLENAPPFIKDWGLKNFSTLESTKNDLKQLFDAGIMIVAGTDNGNFDLNWGDDLIEELRIYKDAGLSNLDVLRTATGNAAKAWNIPIGKLTIGSKLNMVMLNGNPLQDLEALTEIHTIWKTDPSR